ncbi:unnamed protein product [Schistosoma turkestanicum]|nr:unnamed protein product [Schistosoma turkestanicum]
MTTEYILQIFMVILLIVINIKYISGISVTCYTCDDCPVPFNASSPKVGIKSDCKWCATLNVADRHQPIRKCTQELNSRIVLLALTTTRVLYNVDKNTVVEVYLYFYNYGVHSTDLHGDLIDHDQYKLQFICNLLHL